MNLTHDVDIAVPSVR